MNERGKAYQLTFGAVFVALTAIGANITSIVPVFVIGGVPITLQTFFAVLAGLVLGSRLGAISMFVYMMVGLIGVPVFAQFKGGLSSVLSPTFGFVVSFIIVAYIVGKLVENRRSIRMYITAALIGMGFIYLFGTNWLYAAYILWFDAPEGFTYSLAWIWMSVPLPKDIAMAILAGIFVHRLDKAGILNKMPKNTINREIA